MKQYNKFLNIFNIFHSICILILLIFAIFDVEIIYDSFEEILLLYTPFLVLGFNAILGIANFIKKNIKLGIINTIICINCIVFYVLLHKIDSIVVFSAICILPIILSIINLISNKKLEQTKKPKVPIVLFIICSFLEISLIIAPFVILFLNENNLKNALFKLQQVENLGIFIYEKNNSFIFLDDKGNEIIRKNYDNVSNFGLYNININNKVVVLGVAEIGKKTFMIDSNGEIIFELYSPIEQSTWSISSFFNYISKKRNFGIVSTSYISEYRKNKNILNRYTELDTNINSQFEDNLNYEYMYFENNDIKLQIAINKNELENDTNLINIYENCDLNHDLRRDVDKIKEFYKYKKEYYIIHKTGTKQKLECNNLIYDAYYDSDEQLCENILLYSNGYIPFYDKDSSGYFDKLGQKTSITSPFIITDVTDKYRVILNQETNVTYFVSLETQKIEKQISEPLLVFDNFYIQCKSEYSQGYYYTNNILLDKNLNEITSSPTPLRISDNYIVSLSNDKYEYNIYYYDNDKINLIDTTTSSNSGAITPYKGIPNGNNIYYLTGIINYE